MERGHFAISSIEAILKLWSEAILPAAEFLWSKAILPRRENYGARPFCDSMEQGHFAYLKNAAILICAGTTAGKVNRSFTIGSVWLTKSDHPLRLTRH